MALQPIEPLPIGIIPHFGVADKGGEFGNSVKGAYNCQVFDCSS
jgi:hypothetical protein